MGNGRRLRDGAVPQKKCQVAGVRSLVFVPRWRCPMGAIKRKVDAAKAVDTTPDAAPVTDEELVEAVEWLQRAGIVSGERPKFEVFFREAANVDDITDEGDAVSASSAR
jgi:hypothetical protein